MYASISFGLQDIHDAVGAKNTIHSTPKEALMARWRYPSLSLHGIEGAFYSSGAKTVIPAKVIGKFSIRSVPFMTPEKVHKKRFLKCSRFPSSSLTMSTQSLPNSAQKTLVNAQQGTAESRGSQT